MPLINQYTLTKLFHTLLEAYKTLDTPRNYPVIRQPLTPTNEGYQLLKLFHNLEATIKSTKETLTRNNTNDNLKHTQ